MDLVDEKMKATVEAYANDYREMGYDVLFTVEKGSLFQ
jgi:ribosome biogenesis GTPase